MRSDKWEGFVDFCRKLAEHRKTGRASLRREWRHLRDLTEQVAANIPDELVHDLLGKSWATVNPEENDLKALLSYAVGQGLLAPEQVRDALEADNTQSPLFWLAGLSGKTFGESVAPELCAYWIQENGDRWEKQPGTEYYDIAWTPVAIGQTHRIEIKASSENPGFRFQQIRDPRYTGRDGGDYDELVCVGVTASTMEFWSIPAAVVAQYIDDHTFTNQHGGKKMDSNTYWFVTDAPTRNLLKPYSAAPDTIRDLMLKGVRWTTHGT